MHHLTIPAGQVYSFFSLLYYPLFCYKRTCETLPKIMRDSGKWMQNILGIRNCQGWTELRKTLFSEIHWRKFRLHKLSKPWQNSLHALGTCMPHGSSLSELVCASLPTTPSRGSDAKRLCKNLLSSCSGSTSMYMLHQPLCESVPFVSMC